MIVCKIKKLLQRLINSIIQFKPSEIIKYFYLTDIERIGGKYEPNTLCYETLLTKVTAGNLILNKKKYPVKVKHYRGSGSCVVTIYDDNTLDFPNQNAVMDIFDDAWKNNKNGIYVNMVARFLLKLLGVIILAVSAAALISTVKCNNLYKAETYHLKLFIISIIFIVTPIFFHTTHNIDIPYKN